MRCSATLLTLCLLASWFQRPAEGQDAKLSATIEQERRALLDQLADKKADAAESILERLLALPPPEGTPPEPPKFPFTAAEAGEYQRKYADWRGVPVTFQSRAGLTLVLVPPGTFQMGSPEDEPGHNSGGYDETRHQVTLTKFFYLSKHETTVGQFRQFVESFRDKYHTDVEKNGGGHAHDALAVWIHRPGTSWRRPGYAGPFEPRDDLPVVHVSQADSLAFCRWLQGTSQAQGWRYDLPSEAQWECACRAGSGQRYWWGADEDDTGKRLNAGDKTLKRVHQQWPRAIMPMDDGFAFSAPVGSFQANGFGLCDMLGNVWEFCATHYGPYPKEPVTDPADGDPRRGFAVRGGGWSNVPGDARCASRNADPPHFGHSNLGFRVAMIPTPKPAEPDISARLPRDNLLVYRDAKGQPATVKTQEDWLLRRAEILQGVSAIMGKLPGREKVCPLEMKVEEETDCDTYVRRLITYASEPGSRVPAYLLVPKTALADKAPRHPAVLCLHGTDNVVGHGTVVGLGTKPNRQYASELAERGYVTLAPSYPQLAKYQPDIKGLGWESGTLKAVWDNLRGLDLLDSLPYVKPGHYGVIGHSLGGHNGVYTSLFDDRLKAVATSCGLDSYLDYFGGDEARWLPEKGWTQTRYMPRLAQYRGRLAEIPFDFHELIGALAPRHVLIIAPTKDNNFRADSVDRVVQTAKQAYDLFGQPARLRLLHPECGHDFPPEMREAAYRLFDEVLKVKE